MTIHKTLGWGLFGASNIARTRIIAAINAQPDSRVVAVMSRDLSRAETFAREFNIPAAYDSLDAILADPQLDAVYISTTNDLHHAQTLAAARAGKHVLCEKPLALTLDQAGEMVAVCQHAGVVLGTNHHLRNSAIHRQARQLILDGAIGKPLAARLLRAMYLPPNLHGWRINQSDGGGAILDMTVHDADIARFVLNSEVESVVAIKSQQGLAVGDLEDTVMGVMQFRNGVLCQFHDSYVVKHADMHCEIHGTEGSLYAEKAMTQMPVGKLFLRRGDQREEIDCGASEELYTRAVRLFNAAVRGEGEPAADGEDGVRSLQIALAVRESARTGKRITLE
jgi:1,5-anhydro-D-fructose reductase (1,5-anhydro-D-mannitol-forming)